MKIISLELKGFKNFIVNQIQHIKLDFSEKIQLILGTNGSGKSSLMSELSPLPATGKDFEKDGYKKIVIDHQNSRYVLLSDFSTGKHSFLKNNEEYNPGGTQTVQKELVKKEFNITSDLHDLYTGKIRFHSMTVAQRKHWFNVVSKSDFTYALSVYTALKEKLKESQSQLRLIQHRYLHESDKLLDGDKETHIREYIAELKTYLTALRNKQLELSGGPVRDAEFEDLFGLLRIKAKHLIRHTAEYKLLYASFFADINNLEQVIGQLERTRSQLQSKIDLRQADLQALQHVLANIEKNSQFNVTELLAKKTTLSTSMAKRIEQNTIYHYFDASGSVTIDQVESRLHLLEQVEPSLISLIEHIQPDADRKFNKEYYLKVKNDIVETKTRIEHLSQRLATLKTTLDQFSHAKLHNETTCPQCNYVWFRNYNDTEFQQATVSRDETAALLEQNKTALIALNTQLEELTEFFEHHIQYHKTEKAYPTLNFLWDALQHKSVIFNCPERIAFYIGEVKQQLKDVLEICILQKQITDIDKILDELQQNKNNNLTETKAKIVVLEHEIGGYLNDYRSSNDFLQRYQKLFALKKTIDKLTVEIETQQTLIETKLSDWDKRQLKNYIQELIHIVELEIEKQTTLISQVDRQKHLLANLKAQEKELEDKITVQRILTTELSPTQGLIAKGMASFINVFLTEMNAILKKIWLYPMELVLNDLGDDDNAELDYKFSLLINEKRAIPDINRASSAMKEAIDLAYTIAHMKYQGMKDYPLFLDEFGHSMDSAHRFEATKMLHELALYSDFSQLFIISHFENSYGTFRNAQFTVLCKNNIVIPRDMIYNQHITIS